MLAPIGQALRLIPHPPIDGDAFIHIPIRAIRQPDVVSADVFVDRSANDNARAEDTIDRGFPYHKISQDARRFPLDFLRPLDTAGVVNACATAESRRDTPILRARPP